MREIKFRGKKYNGEWIIGSLLSQGDRCHIFPENAPDSCDNYQVTEITVGQYTGLKDKHGVEIYEGDVAKTFSIDDGELIEQVIFIDGCFKLSANSKLDWPISDYKSDYIEVVGNIHDNPELLN